MIPVLTAAAPLIGLMREHAMGMENTSVIANVLAAITKRLKQRKVKSFQSIQYDRRIDEVIRATALATGASISEIQGKRRQFATERHIAMFVCVEVLGLSLSHVGGAFGCDHSTVWYAHQKIKSRGRGRSRINVSVNEIMRSVA